MVPDGVEEPIPVEVTAPDTVPDAAPTAVDRHKSPSASLLDALDHELAMEDAEHGGDVSGDVETAVELESDTVSVSGERGVIQRMLVTKLDAKSMPLQLSGKLSSLWTRSIWCPS